MTTHSTTAIMNPMAQNNNTSPDEHSGEIEAAESKAREREHAVKVVKNAVIVALIIAFVAAGAIAVFSLISDWKNEDLRAAEKTLTELQMAKVKADAARKTEVDTQKVREDAANDLKIKTEEVRQEAKTEQIRIEAEATQKLADAKADLVREQNKLAIEQQRVAEAQHITAEAQKDAARVLTEAQFRLQQITSLHMPRHLIKGGNREKFTQALEDKPVAVIDIKWASDVFIGEPREFAEEIAEALKEAGWIVRKVEGVIIMNDPDPLNLKIPSGLKIFVRDSDNVPASARALHWAFLASDLVAEIVRSERLEGDALSLMVFMIPADGGRVLHFAPK